MLAFASGGVAVILGFEGWHSCCPLQLMTHLGGAAMLSMPEYCLGCVKYHGKMRVYSDVKKRRIAMGRIGIAMGTSVIRFQVNTNI